MTEPRVKKYPRFISLEGLRYAPEGENYTENPLNQDRIGQSLTTEHGVYINLAPDFDKTVVLEWVESTVGIALQDDADEQLDHFVRLIENVQREGTPFWPGLRVDVSGKDNAFITFRVPVLKEK